MSPNSDFSEPSLLVLDDEEVQRMTIHLELDDLGIFVDFADPRPALAYLKTNAVDAVILDIRMPRLEVDGLWFLRELRTFDRDLGVVLRTADDDIEIAQAGLEGRAIQRVIKSEAQSKSRLREAVKLAVAETRERRRIFGAAADADQTREQLASVLGRMDDEISVAEMCRGFVRDMGDYVATVAGYSELFREHAVATHDASLELLAHKNQLAARRLSDQVASFVSNPCAEIRGSSSEPATANSCVEALTRAFRGHPFFHPGKCKFKAKGCLPNVALTSNPTRTLTALRHLIEYCALRAPLGAQIELVASICPCPAVRLDENKEGLVVNRRWALKRPSLLFSVEADIGTPVHNAIRHDLRYCSPEISMGNLMLLGTTLVDDHLAFEVARIRDGKTQLNLFIPIPQH